NYGPQAAAATLTLANCTLPGYSGPARCGELRVSENPERPQGRQIAIGIAVLPATGGRALPDPIVPLFGGPGEEVIANAEHQAGQYAALREKRDILLVDQRGVGRSGALRCRLFDPDAPAASLRHFLPPDAIETCARQLSTRAELTQYTYLQLAHDLEHARKALGYSQFNLHAGSYGTRAAQVFMREYPGSVRSAVLASVVPPDYVTPLTMAKASQAQFESTFAACEADAACRAAYPELPKEFDVILARLEAGTVRASVAGAADAPLGRGRVVEWLRAKLYRPASAAEVPRLIHDAYAGDWTPIIEGILAQARDVDREYALGLWLSITCSEDVAFLREEDIAPASEGTFLRDYRVREQQAACRHWPRAQLPADYREPLRTDIPTMFISGDRDAATPLSFTAHVAPGFSNRVEIVARGQGHTEWNGCLADRFRQFIESGKPGGIDPVCPALPRPPFLLPAAPAAGG
ncbi:MAG: alpha/beta hydrolase, partial [Steroidobacteraceae bacterium]